MTEGEVWERKDGTWDCWGCGNDRAGLEELRGVGGHGCPDGVLSR